MAKERSPNYPAIGLDVAVTLARQIFEKERRAIVPTEVIASALGYSTKSGNLSGNALGRIAALRQYGLLEKASLGKLKISERAINLILNPSENPSFMKAAREAALSPPLFRDLIEEHGEASDDALRVHLIRDRGFISPEAANRVIKAFRDSCTFAGISGVTSTLETDEDAEDQIPEKPVQQHPQQNNHSHEAAPTRARLAPGAVAYSWPLGGGASVELIFTAEPTRANIDILLAQLQIVRSISPENSRQSEDND